MGKISQKRGLYINIKLSSHHGSTNAKRAIKSAQTRVKIIDVTTQAMKTFILLSITCLAISSKDTQMDIINKATVPTK